MVLYSTVHSHLQLASLPENIGALTEMEALSLHKNQLSRLPSSIGKLTGASRMSLYENQLTEVPPEIGNMANLQEL